MALILVALAALGGYVLYQDSTSPQVVAPMTVVVPRASNGNGRKNGANGRAPNGGTNGVAALTSQSALSNGFPSLPPGPAAAASFGNGLAGYTENGNGVPPPIQEPPEGIRFVGANAPGVLSNEARMLANEEMTSFMGPFGPYVHSERASGYLIPQDDATLAPLVGERQGESHNMSQTLPSLDAETINRLPKEGADLAEVRESFIQGTVRGDAHLQAPEVLYDSMALTNKPKQWRLDHPMPPIEHNSSCGSVCQLSGYS